MDADTGPVPLARALGHLLARTSGMRPEDLPRDLAEAARSLGGDEVVLLLVDVDQERLAAFTGAGDDAAVVHPVDGDGPGRAFREEATVLDPLPDGRRRLWVPVRDSADRLGVIGVVDDATVPVDAWELVATLVGELLVSKSTYGDAIVLDRRRPPFSLAAEMRWGLLPPLTFVTDAVVLSGILSPSFGVAGDAFDYAVNGDTVWLAILDAMGHGIEASQMANVAVATFRNERRLGSDPVACLTALDRTIAERFGDLRYVTAQVAELDVATGRLTIANCGHEPPLLLRSTGSGEEIACPPALPAGLGSTPSSVSVDLEGGDAVLFLSDGVVDARSPGHEVFGLSRLAALVASLLASSLPVAEVLRLTARAVTDHQHGQAGDDATMLLVQRPVR